MGLAVKVYEAFKDDERKAKILSEVIDELEARTSHLKDVATKGDLEKAKADIIKWVAALLILQIGVIVSLIKLIP